jgi:hypothetical protein
MDESQMRFFTREKFDSLQVVAQIPSLTDDEFNRRMAQTEWYAAFSVYERHRNSIKETLCESAFRLGKLELHDYKVLEILQVPAGLRVILGSPWTRPRFTTGYSLTFSDATWVGTKPVGEGIIVHEVDRRDDQLFLFAALLDRGELEVRFRDVLIEHWPEKDLTGPV